MENFDDKKISRKQKETKLRKQNIIEAAEKLFLANGYEDTTMNQIATESEFSKGTLYNYFKSKDDLYLAIGTKAYEIIIDYTKYFVESKDPGVDQLKAVGYAYYEFTKNYPDYAHIFHDISIKLPHVAQKSKDKLTANEEEYLNRSEAYGEQFRNVIIKAIKTRSIRSDKDPFLIGFTLFMMTSGIMKELEQHQKTLETMEFDGDDIIDFVFDMIAEGLKPRED
ncbi:MAG: TetR/AcrR family transcriptional regulator [Candidatus Lokiarchaeota archaeon]|nr:TetR/AcrR family transcriptional regulator [Candidatus Lokiarchaeota archaeon]